LPNSFDPGAPTILTAGGPNAIGQMLGLLGDEWNLSIIRAALTGATHYNQFLARLPISNSVLTNRLRVLVDTGLLVKRENPTERERTEYLPTPRSRSLWPVMLPMWAWERDWVTERRDRLPVMKHRACGQEFTPLLRCRKCTATVTDADVSLKLGPSGAWDRCTPAVATRRRQDRPGLYAEMMNVFGNRWAAALLVAAFLGTTRFSDFRAQLGAPSGSLAKRLQTFVSIGVLHMSPVIAPPDYQGPQRSEYLLTDKGRALFPILVGSLNWAHRWFRAPEGPAILLRHRGCGAQLDGELACDQCITSIETGVVWTRPAQRPGIQR
jgi:DNA-binding HxlR family transcriptional regulator